MKHVSTCRSALSRQKDGQKSKRRIRSTLLSLLLLATHCPYFNPLFILLDSFFSSFFFSFATRICCCTMFRKSLSVELVEPVVYLRGHAKDRQTINILRGVVRLQLSHPVLVHSVTVQFIGTAKTLWPEGMDPCLSIVLDHRSPNPNPRRPV